MMFSKDDKADCIQGHHNKCKHHSYQILHQGREIGLNSEYNMNKRQFVANEQGEGQGMENYQKKTSGVRDILTNQSNKIST